jgi:hypothetical protein
MYIKRRLKMQLTKFEKYYKHYFKSTTIIT